MVFLWVSWSISLASVHMHETMDTLLVMAWCSSSDVSARPGLLFSFSYLLWLIVQSPFSAQELECLLPRCWCLTERSLLWWDPHMTSPDKGNQAFNWHSFYFFFFFLMFRVPSCSTFLEWYMESIRTKKFTTWADLLQLWSLGLSHGKHLIRTSWQTGKLWVSFPPGDVFLFSFFRVWERSVIEPIICSHWKVNNYN